MNVRIEAGTLNVALTATMVEPILQTFAISGYRHTTLSTSTRFIPTTVSINGNSISAITPVFKKVGELATSLA